MIKEELSSVDEFALTAFREAVVHLKDPLVDEATLRAALDAPLRLLGLLPRQHDVSKIPPSTSARYVATLQNNIIQHIFPAWSAALLDGQSKVCLDLLTQYFCPAIQSVKLNKSLALNFALHSRLSLLAAPLGPLSIHLLDLLSSNYSLNTFFHHHYLEPARNSEESSSELNWETCVKSIVSVPTKIANALGPEDRDIPYSLQYQ